MVVAKFITSSEIVIASGTGYDWYQALDIAYENLMRVPLEARGDCKLYYF